MEVDRVSARRENPTQMKYMAKMNKINRLYEESTKDFK